jgi:hypothetical protein
MTTLTKSPLKKTIDTEKKSFEMGDEVKLIQTPRDKSSTPKIYKGSVGYVDAMETSLVDPSRISYYVIFPNHNNACLSCEPNEIAHTKQQVDSKGDLPVMPQQLMSEKQSF